MDTDELVLVIMFYITFFRLNNNQHETVNISLEQVVQILNEKYGVLVKENLSKKLKIIRENDFHLKLNIVESEGVSWNVRIVVRILLMREHCSWQQIIFSDDNLGDDEVIQYLLNTVSDDLDQDIQRMRILSDDCSEPFTLCYNLVQSHKNIVEKALVNV